jgi:hypothetical protein
MLDPLTPDLRFEPLLPNPENLGFSFAGKKEALGPHIRARWLGMKTIKVKFIDCDLRKSPSSESVGKTMPSARCRG